MSIVIDGMLLILEEYERRYGEETRDLLYQRVLAILLVGIILIPFFSVLDYVVVREYFTLFFSTALPVPERSWLCCSVIIQGTAKTMHLHW